MHWLSWRANQDSFDVALAVNRLLAAGVEGWWLTAVQGPAEAGDYLLELSPREAGALEALGVHAAPHGGTPPAAAVRVAQPVVALFTGEASGYPYYGYYALCLLRLGLPFRPVDGAAIARGALDSVSVFVIPGGFATWGLDNAEAAPGADAAVRRFLERGGGAIGSCGGAFYLSAGRPGWTGTAWAKPLFTHEYLLSGVGVVELALKKDRLSVGLPPTIDVPYYHGPLYQALGGGIDVVATFRSLVMPGRLGIDNPLDDDKFARTMADRPAALRAVGPRGRAVLFSPHPEMGDLVRKYLALDGYARKYIPIRGVGPLRQTMRHYRPLDAPSFRLVLNAVHDLAADSPRLSAFFDPTATSVPSVAALTAALRSRLEHRPRSDELLAPLVQDIAADLAARIERVGERVDQHARTLMSRGAGHELLTSYARLAPAITARARDDLQRPLCEELMEIELGVSVMEAWTRVAEFEITLAEAQ